MSKSALVTVAVANIRANPLMPLAYVEADLAAIAKPAPDVVMCQEIANTSYRDRFRRAFAAGRRIAGPRHEVPIAYPNNWLLVRAWVKRRHLGVAHITPNRYDTIVKALHPSGFKVCLINTHMVSEAWTHKDRTTRLRRALWRRHIKGTHKAIAVHRDLGYTVIVGGDLNHPGSVSFGPDQVDIYVGDLMQLSVLPAAGVHATAVPARGGKAFRELSGRHHTDHVIIHAGVELEVVPS